MQKLTRRFKSCQKILNFNMAKNLDLKTLPNYYMEYLRKIDYRKKRLWYPGDLRFTTTHAFANLEI